MLRGHSATRSIWRFFDLIYRSIPVVESSKESPSLAGVGSPRQFVSPEYPFVIDLHARPCRKREAVDKRTCFIDERHEQQPVLRGQPYLIWVRIHAAKRTHANSRRNGSKSKRGVSILAENQTVLKIARSCDSSSVFPVCPNGPNRGETRCNVWLTQPT